MRVEVFWQGVLDVGRRDALEQTPGAAAGAQKGRGGRRGRASGLVVILGGHDQDCRHRRQRGNSGCRARARGATASRPASRRTTPAA